MSVAAAPPALQDATEVERFSLLEALPYQVLGTIEVPGLAYESHECLDAAFPETF